ncbi:MAG: alpha/beta hydrolase [Gemmatimonadaceae bacterium]
MPNISDHEQEQVQRANATGLPPVAFLHGLFLLPNSWDRWAKLFEGAGYVAVAPGYPHEPETTTAANADPSVMANIGFKEIADHFERVIKGLKVKPVIVGHSFGGLFAQVLAGRGLSAATVAISPAPHRGVLPLPISALRSAFPVLGNPANIHRAIPLTYDQFRFAFANAVSADEAKTLHETFAVPAAGAPLFEAAAANLNPWSDVTVDNENPKRGPLLIMVGDKDHTAPPVIAQAEFKRQQKNVGVTEFAEVENRGHALTIDSGWRNVADRALEFVGRFKPAGSRK